MIVEWHAAAESELDDIMLGSRRFGPATISGLIDVIEAAMHRLADHPYSARGGRTADTRELVLRHYPFILIYRIRSDRITIVGIQHTAQRWPDEFPE